MANGDAESRSAVLDLKLALDQVEQLEANLEAESVGDVVERARNKLLAPPSLSDTASQMKSILRLNKLSKSTDRVVADVVARCDVLARKHPELELEDGTDAAEVKARALYVKAWLLMASIPAMNMFMRKNGYRKAIEILETSLAACPNQATYLAIGLCRTQLKDRQGAAAAYEACIDLNDETEYALEAARRQRDLGLR